MAGRPKKSKQDHARKLNICPSLEQHELLEIEYAFIPPKARSKHFRELLFEAIAADHPMIVVDKAKDCKRKRIQITLSPDDYSKIESFCIHKYGHGNISSWVLAVLLPDF